LAVIENRASDSKLVSREFDLAPLRLSDEGRGTAIGAGKVLDDQPFFVSPDRDFAPWRVDDHIAGHGKAAIDDDRLVELGGHCLS